MTIHHLDGAIQLRNISESQNHPLIDNDVERFLKLDKESNPLGSKKEVNKIQLN